MESKWDTPPQARRGRKPLADWDSIAEELKSRPHEWQLIGENMPISMGTHISTGRLIAFRPAGHFQGTIRGKKDGRALKVWARYTGGID